MADHSGTNDGMTRDALMLVRPFLMLYCLSAYMLFEPRESALAAILLAVIAAAYTGLRFAVDFLGMRTVARWWWLWLLADLGLVSTLAILTGGLWSRFVILFVGIAVMYSLEFGLRIGLASALGAGLCLFVMFGRFPLGTAFVSRFAMFTSFFLFIAWFTGSMSDDERTLRARLATLASTDSLTGLFNKHQLYERLDLEVGRAQPGSAGFALLTLDVDSFKSINDTHGHLVGDEVLRTIAGVMRTAVRTQDTVYRFGGEEFAIVLPGANTASAVMIGERIRQAIASHEFRTDEGLVVGHLTVSIGVVTFPDHAETTRELLSLVDQALYGSKARGKDRITVGPQRQPALD